ncbi:hypothetical protein N0V90_000849 [Kalmusia sp. IMI 367209]|nr:hypothetical protein N0V90_000849 [Kalmusia sp. IMI 367209]
MVNPYATQRNLVPQPDSILQVAYLDRLASEEIAKVDITTHELEAKEAFRQELEAICQKAFAEKYTSDIASIKLISFGSLASGFATAGSDMDLAIVPEWNDDSRAQEFVIGRDVPRLLERAVLNAKMGGRLLTRTRVPILKVCQTPTDELYNALSEERQKWDELPDNEQYPPPAALPGMAGSDGDMKSPTMNDSQNFPTLQEAKAVGNTARRAPAKNSPTSANDDKGQASKLPSSEGTKDVENVNEASKDRRPRGARAWLREKKLGPLDFPKSGEVGIQCDINFENPLAIHNTQLLRCYSLTDLRVRPMVLFIKAWAKRRKINSAYSGTLSSYGWVLMVLHYLVNIANPPVCPNLQSSWRPITNNAEDLQEMLKETMVGGWAVRFWRNEEEIANLTKTGHWPRNEQSVGSLLLGFFQYYASTSQPNAYGQKPRCLYWANEVLSLRTPGGIRQKMEKGWTKAKTTYSNGKEVRHRYLFSIEDPFELDHNVARTVTHDGIVAIRDELRRAGRILSQIGKSEPPEGGLFDEVVEHAPPPTPNKAEPQPEQSEAAGSLPAGGNPVIEVKSQAEESQK